MIDKFSNQPRTQIGGKVQHMEKEQAQHFVLA